MKIPEGVGWTALMTAYARAQESRRSDSLFDDSWARAVISRALDVDGGSQGLPRLGPAVDSDPTRDPAALWSCLGAYFVARTPFYDDHVLAAVAEGTDQVVLLAAGFDGRAGRLQLPAGTTVFEVDTDPVLDFKETVLADRADRPDDRGNPGPQRSVVRTDLRADWPTALLDAGFDPTRPTVWLAEGLLMYLDAAQNDRLLVTIGSLSAPGSRLATEWFERNPAGEPALVGWPDEQDRHAGEHVGNLFRSGPPAPPADWLGSHGWKLVEVTDVSARAAHHGRPVPWMFDPGHPQGLRVHLVAGSVT